MARVFEYEDAIISRDGGCVLCGMDPIDIARTVGRVFGELVLPLPSDFDKDLPVQLAMS